MAKCNCIFVKTDECNFGDWAGREQAECDVFLASIKLDQAQTDKDEALATYRAAIHEFTKACKVMREKKGD